MKKEELPIDYYDNFSQRKEVECPDRDDAVVIVAMGQSNAANYALFRTYDTTEEVYNYYDGKCYLAKDPLLGGDGYQGSIWITLAHKIAKETGKEVVIQPVAVGGTPIARWTDVADLASFMETSLYKIKQTYETVDFVIWMQGESDTYTAPEFYDVLLKMVLTSVRKYYPEAIFALPSSTYCQGVKNPGVAEVQRKLESTESNVLWLGDTDQYYSKEFRWDDCHYTMPGVQIVTDQFMGYMYGTRQ